MSKFYPPSTTTATRIANTPTKGELLYDTDLDKLFIGDGVTLGGIEVGSSLPSDIMLSSVYDTDGDNIVDLAENIAGTPLSSQYYGTNSVGSKGFYNLPVSQGDMAKSVYDTNNNGIVDVAADSNSLGGQSLASVLSRVNHTGTQPHTTITGLGSAATKTAGQSIDNVLLLVNKSGSPAIPTGIDGSNLLNLPLPTAIAGSPTPLQFYGTNAVGAKGFYDLPTSESTLQVSDGGLTIPNATGINFVSGASITVNGTIADIAIFAQGDMLKTTYDTNNNGAVDLADNATALGGQSLASVLDRTNHTGTQAHTTITGLGSASTKTAGQSIDNVLLLIDKSGSPAIPTGIDGSNLLNLSLPTTLMHTTVYDTNSNGVVDIAEAIAGSPPPTQYYGTDSNGVKGFYSFPSSNKSLTTISIQSSFTANEVKTIDIPDFALAGVIFKIVSDSPCRVRLYHNSSYRLADLSRASKTAITGDHGCYFDSYTQASKNNIRILSPPPVFYTDSTAYFTVTNLTSSSTTINIDLTTFIFV